MELLIFLIFAAVAVCIFTGNYIYIVLAASGLLVLLAAVMTLVFLYCVIRLLFSKKKEASFERIGKPGERSKYKVAFYMVEGREYPCLFPEEGILRAKLYPKGRKCHVFVNYRMGKVFDRYAVITCILGLFFGLAFSIGIITVMI